MKKYPGRPARRLRSPAQGPSQTVSPKLTADVILPPPNRRAKVSPTEPVVWIGASTGGTEFPPGRARNATTRLSGDRYRPAHARRVHRDLRSSPRLVVPNLRQGSSTQRPGAAGSRADRTGEPAHAAQPAGSRICCGIEGRSACLAAPSLGGCAVPFGSKIRRTQRCRRHHDWHGRCTVPGVCSKCTKRDR